MASLRKDPVVERMEKAKDVAGLIKALEHEDWEIRTQAARALGNIKDPAAVKALVRVLRAETDDIGMRRKARRALERIGELAVAPLTDALKDERNAVRQHAAEALGNIRDVRAVQPLIHALQDEHFLVRIAAVIALGRMGDERAVEPLLRALEDEEKAVRKKAVESLDGLGWQPDGTRFPAPPDVGTLEAAGNVEGLVEALTYKRDPKVRKAAAEALGNIGNPAAVEPLISVLNDEWSEYSGTHATAVTALAKIGTPAVEPLAAALRSAKRSDNPLMDPDLNLRVGAARALGEIGDPRAIDVLLRALSDNIPAVRSSAARALGNIGEPAVPELIDVLDRLGKSAPIAAAEALKYISGQDFRDDAAAWRQWWEEQQ